MFSMVNPSLIDKIIVIWVYAVKGEIKDHRWSSKIDDL